MALDNHGPVVRVVNNAASDGFTLVLILAFSGENVDAVKDVSLAHDTRLVKVVTEADAHVIAAV